MQETVLCQALIDLGPRQDVVLHAARHAVKQNAWYAATKVEMGSLQVFPLAEEISREDEHKVGALPVYVNGKSTCWLSAPGIFRVAKGEAMKEFACWGLLRTATPGSGGRQPKRAHCGL